MSHYTIWRGWRVHEVQEFRNETFRPPREAVIVVFNRPFPALLGYLVRVRQEMGWLRLR